MIISKFLGKVVIYNTEGKKITIGNERNGRYLKYFEYLAKGDPAALLAL